MLKLNIFSLLIGFIKLNIGLVDVIPMMCFTSSDVKGHGSVDIM